MEFETVRLRTLRNVPDDDAVHAQAGVDLFDKERFSAFVGNDRVRVGGVLLVTDVEELAAAIHQLRLVADVLNGHLGDAEFEKRARAFPGALRRTRGSRPNLRQWN